MKPSNATPINKTAAIVTQKASKQNLWDIKSKEKKLNKLYWEAPKPMIPPPSTHDLTGLKRGRLTVIGFLGRGKWQCKCVCGNYTSRRPKAIFNEKNDVDACTVCREIAYIKRTYDYRKTGKNKDVRNYY